MPRRGRHEIERPPGFGKALAEFRRDAGFTLSEAAQKAGLDKAYLCRLERRGKRPPPSVLRKLAGPYDVDVTTFLRTFGYQELPMMEGMKAPQIVPDEVLSDISAEERQELKRYLMFLRTRTYVTTRYS